MTGFYRDDEWDEYRYECPECLHDVEVPKPLPNPFVCQNCGHEVRDERA